MRAQRVAGLTGLAAYAALIGWAVHVLTQIWGGAPDGSRANLVELAGFTVASVAAWAVGVWALREDRVWLVGLTLAGSLLLPIGFGAFFAVLLTLYGLLLTLVVLVWAQVSARRARREPPARRRPRT